MREKGTHASDVLNEVFRVVDDAFEGVVRDNAAIIVERAVVDELNLPLSSSEDLGDLEILHDNLRIEHLFDLELQRSVSNE